MILKPKNWNKFQHYKDRNPPWVKLHKEQLNDPDFMMLSLACMGLAQLLWLIASESKEGVIDASEKNLTFRLRKSWSEIKKNITTLIDSGFFIVLADASGLLADDTESCSETETETEKNIKAVCENTINYLNNKTGKQFKQIQNNHDLIKARMNEGFVVEDFKRAIDNQCREWKGKDMETYLRPSTLFSKSKFEGYVNNIHLKRVSGFNPQA